MASASASKQPASLAELRELRDQFAAEASTTSKKIASIDKQIAKAEAAEQAAAREAAVASYLPGLGETEAKKALFKGHDFVFIANNSKEEGHTPDSVLGSSIAAAHKLHTTLLAGGVSGATVQQAFWGNKNLGSMDLNSRFGASAYNTERGEHHNLLPAANSILRKSTPDQHVAGRSTHYVILGNGTVNDKTDDVADVLEAAAKLNPKATFDIVVCSNNSLPALERLAYTLQHRGVKSVTLTKVFSPKSLDEAVTKIVQRRITPVKKRGLQTNVVLWPNPAR